MSGNFKVTKKDSCGTSCTNRTDCIQNYKFMQRSSGTVEDFIVELDRKTGKVVKTFDLKDIPLTS